MLVIREAVSVWGDRGPMGYLCTFLSMLLCTLNCFLKN